MRDHTVSIPRAVSSRARISACALLVAAAALFTASPDVHAADPSPNEVEARFVFQLLNYVTWPEPALPAGATLQIGVLGDDAFAGNLREVIGDKRAQDRRIAVRTVTDASEAGLHLLYLREQDASKLRELARMQHGESVLVVANRFDFPEARRRHGNRARGRTRELQHQPAKVRARRPRDQLEADAARLGGQMSVRATRAAFATGSIQNNLFKVLVITTGSALALAACLLVATECSTIAAPPRATCARSAA
jgi:hypothetical protein